MLPILSGLKNLPSSKDPMSSASMDRGSDILIIEDEMLMRSLIEKYVKSAAFLKGQDTKVHQKENGWDLLEQDLGNIRVAIVDILLPRVTGVDLIRDLRRRHPEMSVIAVTGMATEPMKRAILEMIPENFLLQKPLRKDIFSQAFYEAWNQTLPKMPTNPPLLKEESGEALWSSLSADLRTTEIPVVRRRLGRKKTEEVS